MSCKGGRLLGCQREELPLLPWCFSAASRVFWRCDLEVSQSKTEYRERARRTEVGDPLNGGVEVWLTAQSKDVCGKEVKVLVQETKI